MKPFVLPLHLNPCDLAAVRGLLAAKKSVVLRIDGVSSPPPGVPLSVAVKLDDELVGNFSIGDDYKGTAFPFDITALLNQHCMRPVIKPTNVKFEATPTHPKQAIPVGYEFTVKIATVGEA